MAKVHGETFSSFVEGRALNEELLETTKNDDESLKCSAKRK